MLIVMVPVMMFVVVMSVMMMFVVRVLVRSRRRRGSWLGGHNRFGGNNRLVVVPTFPTHRERVLGESRSGQIARVHDSTNYKQQCNNEACHESFLSLEFIYSVRAAAYTSGTTSMIDAYASNARSKTWRALRLA
jgi:hypothetical protein